MIKKIVLVGLMLLPIIPGPSHAANYDTYIVQRNDTLWKIAVKYKIGVDEIINANKQIPNPNMIYPMQQINIPNIDETKNIEQQVLQLVNQERSKAGLKALSMNWELQRTARVKACDMSQKGYFDHNSPTYGSPFDMMRAFGVSYRTAGENIAAGQKTPAEVMQSWMNSQGHRENILKSDFSHLGVGYCEGGSMSPYWVQMFIGK